MQGPTYLFAARAKVGRPVPRGITVAAADHCSPTTSFVNLAPGFVVAGRRAVVVGDATVFEREFACTLESRAAIVGDGAERVSAVKDAIDIY